METILVPSLAPTINSQKSKDIRVINLNTIKSYHHLRTLQKNDAHNTYVYSSFTCCMVITPFSSRKAPFCPWQLLPNINTNTNSPSIFHHGFYQTQRNQKHNCFQSYLGWHNQPVSFLQTQNITRRPKHQLFCFSEYQECDQRLCSSQHSFRCITHQQTTQLISYQVVRQ